MLLPRLLKLGLGRDGIIREAVIKYCNSSKQKLSLTKGGKNDRASCEETDQDIQY